MEQLSHERSDVYHRSIEFLGTAEMLIQHLPKGYAKLADQLHRAALSIPLHIAAACGKPAKRDRRHRFTIARGLTLECGAILDALHTMQLVAKDKCIDSKELLVRIASMLTKLVLPN